MDNIYNNFQYSIQLRTILYYFNLFFLLYPTQPFFCSPHPDAVVETASLAAVAPPRPNYNLAMPTDEKCGLSSLQLETVVYACMRHETLIPDASGQGFVRAGFYLGDGCVQLFVEFVSHFFFLLNLPQFPPIFHVSNGLMCVCSL